MAATFAAQPQQINLFNPALRPARERLSARQLVVWAAIVSLALGGVAYWAISETRSLQREMAQQSALATAPRPADTSPTPQQVAALEQTLKDKIAVLETRKATYEASRRGMASADRGPSALMRFIADTIPATAWLTELRAGGSRLDVSGRALEPSVVESWLERLRASGRLAQSPAPSVRVERIEAPAGTPARGAPVYLFAISAALASPLAEEGAR